MASKTFSVKEAPARKLVQELGKKGKSLPPKKLTTVLNGLADEIDSLDDDLIQALSKGSASLLEKIVKASTENSQKIVLEVDEADDDEEKPAKGKAAKNGKPAKKTKNTDDGEVSIKTQQSRAIMSVVNNGSGPMTVAEIHKKAAKKVDMTLARVQGHMNWMVGQEKAKKVKGDKYAVV